MRSPRFLFACLLSSFAALLGSPAYAQINPDQTLGAEASMVTPDVVMRGGQADLIEGGAIRGGNLFHSFSDFNVLETERVYFANPVGVDSILSRVTGRNPSDILGTLGVDGAADLWLINPNGIVFGESALLDVSGAFYGTTAEAVDVGEGVFSAVSPEQSQLLVIKPTTSFWNYLTVGSGDVVSRAQLSAGEDLVLAGRNLDLQGQVLAGGNVSLLASEAVQIRDTVATPFIGAAGDNLLIQGNQLVDIAALSHPESGLFSNGDMRLRSAAPVRGDAHYWSGANFRVEQLDETAGSLYSPDDPIVFADGDIFLESYRGASLHLWAGGSIGIPRITITGADTTGNAIAQTITLSDGTLLAIDGTAQPTLDLRAGVDWSQLSGTLPGNLSFGINIDPSAFGDSATASNILVGNISMDAPGGIILLTNQFLPNPRLPGGDVVLLNGIDATGVTGDGSSIVVDAANNIFAGSNNFFPASLTSNSFIDTGSGVSNGGDITFLAQQSVNLLGASNEADIFVLSNVGPGAVGDSGTISIRAENLVLSHGQISNSLFGTGDTGLIDINVSGSVALINNSQIFSTIASGGVGDGKGININARSLGMSGESQILSIVREPSSESGFLLPAGQGNAGDINITVAEDIVLTDGSIKETPDGPRLSRTSITSAIAPEASGSVGNITISASSLFLDDRAAIGNTVDDEASGEPGTITLDLDRLELDNGANISSTTSGQGNAGNIDIKVSDGVTLANRSHITSSVIFGATGDAGTIDIQSGTLDVTAGSTIQSAVFPSFMGEPAGIGNAGNINVRVRDRLLISGQQNGELSGITTELGEETTGTGGGIFIQSAAVVVDDGASVSASTLGAGKAGRLQIVADTVRVDNDGGIESQTSSAGDAGDIQLDVNRLLIDNGGFIIADSLPQSSGLGGTLFIDAREIIEINGFSANNFSEDGVASTSGLYAQTRSDKSAGNINLVTNRLLITGGGSVSAETSGGGDGGDISVVANSVEISGGAEDQPFSSSLSAGAEANSSGNAGDISITAGKLTATAGGFIASSARTGSTGDAGNVTLDITDSIELIGETLDGDNSTAVSVAVELGASGDAGNIRIDTARLGLRAGGSILAQNLGSGQSGSIDITAKDSIEIVSTQGGLSLVNSAVGPFALNRPDAPSRINIQTSRLSLLGGGQIATRTFGSANASDIRVSASEGVEISGISEDGVFPSGLAAGSFSISQEQFEQVDNSAVVVPEATGRGGNIVVDSDRLAISDQGEISSEALSPGDAGNITLILDALNMQNGTVSTESLQGSGGIIQIQANSARLFEDSDITTAVAQGGGKGGNIVITADSLIALDDSDILAFAADGQGGDIDFGETAFFGENVVVADERQTPRQLDGNGRVDINAVGQTASGTVTISDVSFIENNFADLPANLVNAETLVANSCIARSTDNDGTLTLTGRDRLPQSPNEALTNLYPAGTVQTIFSPPVESNAIVEPEAIYQLADGRLVMSHTCE